MSVTGTTVPSTTTALCGATVYSDGRPPGGYWVGEQPLLIDQWCLQQQGPHEDSGEPPLKQSFVSPPPRLHRRPVPTATITPACGHGTAGLGEACAARRPGRCPRYRGG
jgi:hypothetical protein